MEIVTPKNAALMDFYRLSRSFFFFLYNVSNYDIGLQKKKRKKDTVGRLRLSQINKCTYFSHVFTFTVCDIISRHVLSCAPRHPSSNWPLPHLYLICSLL